MTRLAIAYGPVHQAVIGHPQYQHVTIIGTPVNIANHLCEAAVRDRNIILLDEHLCKKLADQVVVHQLPKENLGKAISLISSGYELLRLK
ncbi:MAG: hypothetical protein HY652_00665 [Acidobacteria bacterium]|nr:hypothetical protein [Acidobacteriota bacterium]